MVFVREKIVNQVKNLVKEAGEILLKEFNLAKQERIMFKGKHEIITRADFLAEKVILKKLRVLTPNFRIISEERGDNQKKSDYLWTIDPLDGTTNFYMGNPLFATQLALVYKNEPVLSFVYAPFINEFYFAKRGKGAYLNGRKIKVSRRGINRALLTFCHGNTNTDIKKAIKIYSYFKLKNFDIRQIGSAALEFAWVAKGRTDCYISPGTRIWDIAPGALLVKEAGGKLYEFSGKSWQLKKSKTVFAGNGIIDKNILKFLKKL
jgi:myo-inositol-1(or 4)-monophosphatase